LAASPKYQKIGLVVHGNPKAKKRLVKAAAAGSKAWESAHKKALAAT
jgi:hypothetical protein